MLTARHSQAIILWDETLFVPHTLYIPHIDSRMNRIISLFRGCHSDAQLRCLTPLCLPFSLSQSLFVLLESYSAICFSSFQVWMSIIYASLIIFSTEFVIFIDCLSYRTLLVLKLHVSSCFISWITQRTRYVTNNSIIIKMSNSVIKTELLIGWSMIDPGIRILLFVSSCYLEPDNTRDDSCIHNITHPVHSA